MKIDLKKPGALSLALVVELLRSKDDSAPRQVRVSADGIVFLSDEVGNQNIDRLLCRFETFQAGNDYVGTNITANDEHAQWIFKELSTYPNFKSTYLDS